MRFAGHKKTFVALQMVPIAIALLLTGCGREPAEFYPGAWREDVNPAIIAVLLTHQVQGCGDLVYKPAHNSRWPGGAGEFLVYCTDGERQRALLVFIRSATVNDVIPLSSLYDDIPPPARWRTDTIDSN